MAMLTKNAMWKALERDLPLVGFRNRRAHDLRRTGISLYRNAGAVRDILNWATHGRSRDKTIDDYTNLEWETLCREIVKLQLAVPQSAATPLATRQRLASVVVPVAVMTTGK
jgi:integrase